MLSWSVLTRLYLTNFTMAAPIRTNLPDGEWTCRWVNDFCYSKDWSGKDISASCLVNYSNSSGEIKNLFSYSQNLYRTIIGSKVVVKNGTAISTISNPAQNRKIYQTKVTDQFLSQVSSCLFYHLGLTYEQHSQAITDSTQFQELMRKLHLPPKFGYTNVHCITNPDSSSSIQHFIIPSYEVLRYFFLHGNTLSNQFLSYFTGRAGKDKLVCQGIPELVTHPTGKPLVMPYKGERVAFLEMREGLSKTEILCLARIAFITQAADCLEEIRGSILLNSVQPDKLPDKWYAFKSLRTILPQNQPFTIAACGREFSWQGKSYLLVDQLYDTKEEMPFDKISYSPIVDHRSKAVPLNPVSQKQQSPRTKTKSAASPQLTANELGNDNQPTTLTDSVDTVSVFGTKPEIVKLPKKDQKNQYHTVGISQEVSELLSLLERGIKEAGPGRAQVNSGVPDTHTQVRNLFLALKSLPNYRCTYLDLDHEPPLFRDSYYLNRTRPGLPYAIVLGCLKPYKSSTQVNVYFIWASTIRYAFFYAPTLQPIDLSVLTQLYNDIFGKEGIIKMPPEDKLEFCHRYNPADLSTEGLISRMETNLRSIIDSRKRR